MGGSPEPESRAEVKSSDVFIMVLDAISRKKIKCLKSFLSSSASFRIQLRSFKSLFSLSLSDESLKLEQQSRQAKKLAESIHFLFLFFSLLFKM